MEKLYGAETTGSSIGCEVQSSAGAVMRLAETIALIEGGMIPVEHQAACLESYGHLTDDEVTLAASIARTPRYTPEQIPVDPLAAPGVESQLLDDGIATEGTGGGDKVRAAA